MSILGIVVYEYDVQEGLFSKGRMLVWLPDQCPVYPMETNTNHKYDAWDDEPCIQVMQYRGFMHISTAAMCKAWDRCIPV